MIGSRISYINSYTTEKCDNTETGEDTGQGRYANFLSWNSCFWETERG